jgi:ATP-dependent Clp protease ATP-binding subunit ClpB
MRHFDACTQVLGRNLEALITRAEELKKRWKDDFTSVEHLVLAFPDDARFGRQLLRDEGLDGKKLEAAVKDIRGTNRVTDQARTRAPQGLTSW